ncbi:aegerolysin type hemolysin, partial [Sparassis latifolia]
AEGDKHHEVSIASIEDHVIPARDGIVVSSCGREESPSGTKGSFDVVDTSTDALVRTVFWDCPYVRHNRFETRGANKAWIVDHSDVSKEGALGEIKVTFLKL